MGLRASIILGDRGGDVWELRHVGRAGGAQPTASADMRSRLDPASIVRIALYWFVGFVVGSLILGAFEGNPFRTNLVYGLKTGILAAVVVAALLALVRVARTRS